MSQPQKIVIQQQTNTIGQVGMILAIISLFCGGLMPIALVLCFVGMFYQPNQQAIVGLIICVVTLVLWAVLWFTVIAGIFAVGAAATNAIGEAMVQVETSEAGLKVQRYYSENQVLPDEDEFDQLIGSEKIRVEIIDEKNVRIIHRGQDQEFGTEDDNESEVDASLPVVEPNFEPQVIETMEEDLGAQDGAHAEGLENVEDESGEEETNGENEGSEISHIFWNQDWASANACIFGIETVVKPIWT